MPVRKQKNALRPTAVFKHYALISGIVFTCLLVSLLHRSSNISSAQEEYLRLPFHYDSSYSSHYLSAPGQGLTSTEAATYEAVARHQLAKFKTKLLADSLPAIQTGDIDELWRVLQPTIGCPADRPLTKYGGQPLHHQLMLQIFGYVFRSDQKPPEDGAKLMCKVPSKLQHSPCVVYSLGSNGDYSFEQAMLAETRCEVHTFDCTFKGTSQHTTRHFYHQWCLGKPDHAGQYRTWANITQALGHSSVDILKMDIEGDEYAVLSSFQPEDNLPAEIAVELHALNSPAEIVTGLLQLAELGYAMYSMEVNALAAFCCCEFTFMRFPSLPAA